jgi:hypothetical protein
VGFKSLARGRVGKADSAGGVESFLPGAGGETGAQDGVLVVVVSGGSLRTIRSRRLKVDPTVEPWTPTAIREVGV